MTAPANYLRTGPHPLAVLRQKRGILFLDTLIIDADAAYAANICGLVETALPVWSVATKRTLSGGEHLEAELVIVDHQTLISCVGSARAALEWIRLNAGGNSALSCIVLAEPSDELLAVACIKAGAIDYIPKRLFTEDLLYKACAAAMPNVAGEDQSVDTATAVVTAPPPANDDTVTLAHIKENGNGSGSATSSGSGQQPAKARVAMPSRKRLTVEGYKVIRKLGEGGMASVHLALSEELRENVVLKIMRILDQSEDGKAQYERFVREYELISRINSLAIVDIYDFGLRDEFAYIAMEYFPCGDLSVRLQNPVSPVDCAKYLYQLAQALAIVHKIGVLHRDLKPANVMVREDNSLSLIDFGLAKGNNSDAITAPGEMHGTPYYMSPEQVRDHPLDERSDLYALGVMFYEMLAGERPFTGGSTPEVLYHHLSTPIPRLPEHLARFQSTIDLMLAKDPAERVQTAKEVAKIAQALAQGVSA